MAGTHTVSSMLLWALVYLTRDISVQACMRREIHDTIGRDEPSSYSQMSILPFTEATLYEIQRLAHVVPHGIIHATSSDTHFEGYYIPKGTRILTNLHSVLYDKTIWGDPETFRPGRFLDDEGHLMRAKTNTVIAFAMGR